MKTRLYACAGMMLAAVMGTAPAAPGATTDPEVFLSLRGVVDDTIEIGEPLFVGVRIEAPFESMTPLVLAPASGTWADRVEVVLLRGEAPLPSRATPTFAPANAGITLDAEHAASGEWHFAAAQTHQLAAGDYVVQVRVAIGDGTGWKGEVTSEPTTLRVVAVANTPERVLQRTIALANEALAADRLQDGVRLVDTLLADQPDNLRLLAIRARLCARAGDLRSAMTCVTRAMSTEEVEKLTHPPIGLFELQEEIGEAMLSPAARNATPPEWTKLPPRVLEIIRPSKSSANAIAAPASPAPIATGGVTQGTPPATTPALIAPVPAASATPAPRAGAPSNGIVIPVPELDDAKIIADPAGQWASGAAAGSQYGSPGYAAAKMTGAPDVPKPGDHPNAWTHGSSSQKEEWVELTFAKPVYATEVRVRQTNCPGAIARVVAIEPDGTTHLWWEGTDKFKPTYQNTLAWFAVRVTRTDYLVAKVKITLNLMAMPGWKEIDAVQLVGSAP